MSVSIYYTATRPTPITQSERLLIDAIVRMHSVDKKIEKYLQTGEGLNCPRLPWAESLGR